MIPIVGVSLEEALLGFGGDDTELHDKEVTLTTSDVTGSQTAIFEYDPEDEDPQGTPPGPWDGYSLFTIDLSAVKDDIEDMLARIAALEDELEDCHDCRDAVVAAIQEYDPDYDPAEGECPAPKVGEIVDHAKDCDDCKAEVVAKLQEYDPDFDPQTCEDIVDKIGEIEEEAEKPPQYTFEQDPTSPTYPDPNFYDNLITVIGTQDTVTDDTLGFSVVYSDTPSGTTRHRMTYKIVYSDGSEIYLRGVDTSGQVGDDRLIDFRVTDPSTGTYTYYWVGGSAWMGPYSTQLLIGYGDPTHSYTVTKNS